MTATVLLTFDFDAESPWLQPDVDDAARDLTQLSWGAYGARRGITRILRLLDELDIQATFFVPGWTVDAHADRVREIYVRGHEIGHHGYRHLPPVGLSAAEQREDLRRGIEAIERCVGERPRGYRSPSWQLTPTTFALLGELDFTYDSSCMGDDRPYFECCDGEEVLELPVHWALDDFPHLGWTSQHTGPLHNPRETVLTWRLEVEAAIREDRAVVLTCHPELTGRASPMNAFAGFIRELSEAREVRFARCIDFAQDFRDALQ